MNTIYYFSGTGNSYSVARDIAKEIKDTKLKSIRNKDIGNIKIKNQDKVGLVLPVYAWGMPRIVSEFLENTEFENNSYIFAIATAGGVIGSTLKKVNDILKNKGTSLNVGFGVRSASYAFDPEAEPMGLIKFIQFLGGKKVKGIKDFKTRKDEIINMIMKKKNGKIETTNFLADTIGGFFHSVAVDAFKKEGQKYLVNDSCNQCGVCISLCPRENIIIEGNKVKWMENCEGCRACAMWCPEKAIGYEGVSEISQSTNPTVNLKDLLPE
ncbi:MAG: EFR1 family ferrodoxin [Fusobacteriota bacterium]